MLISNLTSRLRLNPVGTPSLREAERLRIKNATKCLRTHAEKIAWHLAEIAAAAPQPQPARVKRN